MKTNTRTSAAHTNRGRSCSAPAVRDVYSTRKAVATAHVVAGNVPTEIEVAVEVSWPSASVLITHGGEVAKATMLNLGSIQEVQALRDALSAAVDRAVVQGVFQEPRQVH